MTDNLTNNGYFIEIQFPFTRSFRSVHGPSSGLSRVLSVLIVRKRNLPGGTRSINQTSSRVRIGVRGLFVLGLDYLSLLHRSTPPPHVTVNATVHTFTLSRARAKARRSYSYVTLCTDRKEEKGGERSRDLTLFTLEGL